MSDLSKLASLMEAVYSAAVEPQQWPQALQQVSDAFSAVTTGLVVQDLASGTFPLAVTNPSIHREALALYIAYYGKDDPLRVAGSRRPGEILTDQSLVTSEMKRSETYNDFYKRFRLNRFISYGWGKDEGRAASLVIYRSPEAGAFEPVEERMMSLLVPHIRRAVRVTWELSAAREEASLLGDALDRLATAVILLDVSGKIVRMNRSANDLLLEADGLYSSSGSLSTALTSESIALQRIIAANVRGSALDCSPQVVVTRPSGAPSLTVLAAPITTARGDGGVMLLISDPRRFSSSGPELRASYGFTATEAAIALRLIAGATLNEISDERRSSVHTVRSHVKSLLHKANARNQADLVRIILGSAAAGVRSGSAASELHVNQRRTDTS